MKQNIETITKLIDQHRKGLLTKLGQDVSLGALVTMSLRDIMSSRFSGGNEPRQQKRGTNGIT